jgi:hypothetical protein
MANGSVKRAHNLNAGLWCLGTWVSSDCMLLALVHLDKFIAVLGVQTLHGPCMVLSGLELVTCRADLCYSG